MDTLITLNLFIAESVAPVYIYITYPKWTEYECVNIWKYDIPQISVYASPEKIDQTSFALDAAVKLLDFYDDFFDIPYPLPKQGMWSGPSSWLVYNPLPSL